MIHTTKLNRESTMPRRVWGVSRLRDLKVCPAMFVAKYETKQWTEVPSPQMDRGSKVHTTLENSLKYDLQLPPELDKSIAGDFCEMLLQIRDRGGVLQPEFKFGLDINFNMVDFFKAENLRARVGLDVWANSAGAAQVIDWKTGRYKPEHRDDARFYGAAAFIAMRPNTCAATYVYIDEPQNSFTFPIEKPEAIMTSYWEQFTRADEYLDGVGTNGAVRSEDPPMNPGTHCNWCGDVECPHNKNEKAQAIAAAASKNIFKG